MQLRGLVTTAMIFTQGGHIKSCLCDLYKVAVKTTEMFLQVAAVDESLLAELTEMTPVNLEFTPGGYKNLIHLIYTKWPQKNNRFPLCANHFSHK